MKTISYAGLGLIILAGFISISCSSTPNETGSKFDPVTLAGTKWVEIDPLPGFVFTLEFEDSRFCIWSFQGHRMRLEYSVRGNTIILANNTSYVIDGDILLESKGFSKKPRLTKEY